MPNENQTSINREIAECIYNSTVNKTPQSMLKIALLITQGTLWLVKGVYLKNINANWIEVSDDFDKIMKENGRIK